jgi:hypothetical protein
MKNSLSNLQFLLVIFLGILASTSYSQAERKAAKYAQVPTDLLLVVVAQQPDSPIKIENVKPLFNLEDRRIQYEYELRNVSAKRIRRIGLSIWQIGGGGGDLVPFEFKKSILPAQKFDVGKADDSLIVDLDDSLKKQIGFVKEGMATISLVYVKTVWFEDGTIYEPMKTVNNLFDFLNKLAMMEDN